MCQEGSKWNVIELKAKQRNARVRGIINPTKIFRAPWSPKLAEEPIQEKEEPRKNIISNTTTQRQGQEGRKGKEKGDDAPPQQPTKTEGTPTRTPKIQHQLQLVENSH